MTSERSRQWIAFSGIAALLLGAFFLISRFRGEPVFRDVESELFRIPDSGVTPSETGPWPKAELEQEQFQFGKVFEGQEAVLATRIHNRGEAPLRLSPGRAICDCIFIDFPSSPIAVGDSAEIKLAWRPRPGTDAFEKSVIVNTNDPQRAEIRLGILGSALPVIVQSPQDDWEIPEIFENRPTEFVGEIMSPLREDFTIESIDVGNAPLKVEVKQVSRAGANVPQGDRPGNKLVFQVRPEMPIGSFRFPIRIVTNIPPLNGQTLPEGLPGQEITVQLTGVRRGPFRFLGANWYPDRRSISLGTFPSQKGIRAKLVMLCEDQSIENLEILELRSDVADLQFSHRKDANFKGRGQKFEIELIIPPGSPPTSRRSQNAAKIWIKTNHPANGEVEVLCDFTAA
ncbi:MAG: DUF1573 domain-containing protein [Planctomycetaceae bacterium]|jgi:hypothetical protein